MANFVFLLFYFYQISTQGVAIKVKSSKFGVLILSATLLTSCSSEKALTIKAAPTYELGQRESQPITEDKFFQGIQGSSSGSPATDNQTERAEMPTETTNEKTVEGRKTVTVSRVIDADTIAYYEPNLGKEVTGRLIGINAPEYTKTKQQYGAESTEYLKGLILGKEIEIESDPNADLTDKYGRYLIHAFISGRSIQATLLTMGLVRVAYLYGEYKYVDTFREAESLAQQAGKNIWSLPGYVDDKNGFNMDVISSGKESLTSKTSEISDSLK